MLCLVGTDVDPGRSFLCQEAAAGRSLGFRGGDKEGAFPQPPSGVRRTSSGTGPVQGQFRCLPRHLWAGTSCAQSGGRQGAPLHPEPEAPGRCRLSNPAGLCSSPRATRGSTCRSEVPPPTPHRAFGSRTGPLRVISHSWSLPSTQRGFRKREPLQDVWEMTGEFNRIILV